MPTCPSAGNVPLIAWAVKIAYAVAAGNAIILKTSEKSPLSGLHLAALTAEAGFSPGVSSSNGFTLSQLV